MRFKQRPKGRESANNIRGNNFPDRADEKYKFRVGGGARKGRRLIQPEIQEARPGLGRGRRGRTWDRTGNPLEGMLSTGRM